MTWHIQIPAPSFELFFDFFKTSITNKNKNYSGDSKMMGIISIWDQLDYNSI